MIELLAVLLAPQAQAMWTANPTRPTVGDTVYLTRTLPAPAGTRVRPQPVARTPTVEPLAAPVVEQRGGLTTVRYAIALFESGPQLVPMPSVEVVYADGTTETILGDTARVGVRSVLPDADSLPPPRPSLGPLARPLRAWVPLIVLLSAVFACGGVWLAARRRTREPLMPLPAQPARAGVPLVKWVEAGEVRAAASLATARLRDAIAWLEPAASGSLSAAECLELLRKRHAEWPLDDLAEVLGALERARFAPAVPSDVRALAEQVDMLVARLGQARRASA